MAGRGAADAEAIGPADAAAGSSRGGRGREVSIIRLFKAHQAAALASSPAPEPIAIDDQHVDALIHQLDQDINLAIGVVDHKTRRSKRQIAETIAHIDEIGRAGDELAEFAAAAKIAAATMTETMQRLDAATRAIERNAASADLFAEEASQLARDLGDSTQRMNLAVEKITGVVQLITTIARRTNLLALNASIEAARAGPAGRGFSIIASEMKTLAQQVHAASGDVTSQTANLQTAARSSTDATKRIGALLTRIDPVFGAIRGALEAQATQSRDVAAHAAQSETFVGYVVSKAAALKAAAREGARSCRDAGATNANLHLSLRRLTQRAIIFLRHCANGDRRLKDRVPLRLEGVFVHDGAATPAAVIDLSRGGALLMRTEADVRAGAKGRLRLTQIGSVTARVVGKSELGLHMQFGDVEPETMRRIDAAIDAARQRYAPWILRAQKAAADIQDILEAGLACGEVTLDELITTDYRPVKRSDPVQYTTLASAFYEKMLPPALDEHRRSPEAPLFVLAIDRNGYLPVRHADYAAPEGGGDGAWNDFNARGRRLFEGWTTLLGARSEAPSHLRAYQFDGDGAPEDAILIVSAPVYVERQLWGAVQAGFRY